MAIDPVTSATWSSQLADKLDEADGVKDGKITASIWNNFMAGTGSNGNRINKYITLDRAIVSFNFYKNRKDVGQVDWSDANKLLDDVKDQPGNKMTMDVLASDTTPPARSVTIPASGRPAPAATDSTLSDAAYTTPVTNNAGKEITVGDKTYVYGDNGYVTSVKNSAGYTMKEICRDDDGNFYSDWTYIEYAYDSNGNLITQVYRKPDGTFQDKTDGLAYVEWLYDTNNRKTDRINYNNDGIVNSFLKFTYDANGNRTRAYYRADGNIDEDDGFAYVNDIYDSNGNITRTIYRQADGSLRDPADGCAYIDYEYDSDGNVACYTSYNSAGEVYQ